MRIEFHYLASCPNAQPARALLHSCLEQLGLDVPVLELEGLPSPSIVVDGRDVMGEPATRGRSCRLDLPTRRVVLEALHTAMQQRGDDVDA